MSAAPHKTRAPGLVGWGHWIFSEARREWPLLAAGLGVAAVHGAAHAGLAVAAGLAGRELALGGEVVSVELERACYFGLGAAIVKAIASISLAFVEGQAAARGAERLRRGALRAVLNGGLHDAAPRVLATIAVRVREVEHALRWGALGTARSLAQIVPLGAALIALSPVLSAASLLVLGPFAVVMSVARRRLRAAHAGSQALAVELHAGVDELVSNADLWRAYGAGPRVLAATDRASLAARGALSRSDAGRAALSAGNEVLAALALLGAVLLARTAGVPMGDGSAVAFMAVFFMAYRPLRDLGDARGWLDSGRVAFESLPLAPSETETAGEPPRSFSLEHLVVEGVGAVGHSARSSFTVAPGEILAVTGPTGSGKTTLLRCLLGLAPAVGRVRYGDREIGGCPVGPSARPFAWVPQEAPLVTGTVLENVSLLGASTAAASRALEELGAEGLAALRDEVVGPGGRPLSGGERRLVALARALASGLPVMLLDEPTEGLDARASRRVLDAIGALGRTRSVIVVTHRDEVVAVAHRVATLGRDAPSGPVLRAVAR